MFEFQNHELTGYAVALGIGLLVGAERERRKGEGPYRNPFGIRSFAVVALTGAVASSFAMPLLLVWPGWVPYSRCCWYPGLGCIRWCESD